MAYVEARQYSNASDMLASAAAIRARLIGKARSMVKPMVIVEPVHIAPEPMPEIRDRWKVQHNAHMVNWAWGKSFKDYEKQTLETEGEFVPFHVEKVRIETIINKVSRYFDIPVIDLKSARRTRNIVMPRQVAMYLAKTLTGKSLPEIGRMFGGRDHTTILHGVRTVEERRHHHHIIAKAIDDLTADLQVAL